MNPISNPGSQVITFTTANLPTRHKCLDTQELQKQIKYQVSSPNKSFTNFNFNSNSTSKNFSSKSNSNPVVSDHSMALLATHGRSHSVNNIKINGNQLNLTSTQIEDISIGIKDMKPGSRAPIALSEEL
jgi:pectin methylesterase-like acyl-CoA thioesterase